MRGDHEPDPPKPLHRSGCLLPDTDPKTGETLQRSAVCSLVDRWQEEPLSELPDVAPPGYAEY